MNRKDANKLKAALEYGEGDPDCPPLQKHVAIDRQLYMQYFMRLIDKQVPVPGYFAKKWRKIYKLRYGIAALIIAFAFYMVGCSTHKHCGTAHYSEMTSQDFQQMKQNMQTEYYLMNARELRH